MAWWTKPQGVLSGIEIVDAVERQKKYLECVDKYENFPHSAKYGGLGTLGMLHMRWLKGQPRIHIDDFNSNPSDLGGCVNPNSYNLRLGNELKVYDVPIIKPELRHSVGLAESDWDQFALDPRRNNVTKNIPFPEEGVILKPDRLYLGRTHEYTESFNCRPCVAGRSSIGRLGLFIHVTAGYGDVGFKGTWTLEMVVVHPVRIYPLMSICQIDYATVSARHRPYMSKKYQGQRDVTASRLYTETERERSYST